MTRNSVVLFLALVPTSPGFAQSTKHTPAKSHAHVITEGDMKIIQDCHELYLDAREAGGDDYKPKHSTAYSCYTTEKPVYDTLVDLHVKDKLNEKGERLLDLVRSDIAYFELALDEDEK